MKFLRIFLICLFFLLGFSTTYATSTARILDNATGGDCSVATTTDGTVLGVWDNPTKTCTLNTDFYSAIFFYSYC